MRFDHKKSSPLYLFALESTEHFSKNLPFGMLLIAAIEEDLLQEKFRVTKEGRIPATGNTSASSGRHAYWRYLTHRTQDKVRASLILKLRQAVGDQTVLNLIGDLRELGINDQINKKVTVEVQEYDIRTPIYNRRLNRAASISASRRGTVSQAKEVPLFLFGEHRPVKRIEKFWEVVIERWGMGDTVEHAVRVAHDYLTVYKELNSSHLFSAWKAIRENHYTSGAYAPKTPDLFKEKAALASKIAKKTKVTLYAYGIEVAERYFPSELEKHSQGLKKPKPGKSRLIEPGEESSAPKGASSRSDMLLMGVGAVSLILGLRMLGGR